MAMRPEDFCSGADFSPSPSPGYLPESLDSQLSGACQSRGGLALAQASGVSDLRGNSCNDFRMWTLVYK